MYKDLTGNVTSFEEKNVLPSPKRKRRNSFYEQAGSNTGNSREIYSRDKQLRLQNVVKQCNTMDLYSYLEEVGTIINL